jgi:Na+/alanine symporter
MFCTSLFVVLFFFCQCVVFDLLILISPLVSSSRRMKSKGGNRRSDALEKSAVANLYEINVYVSIVFSAFKTSVQNYSGNTTNVLYQ